MSSRFSRRAFVGGLVGLGGLLAACGGKDASGAQSAPSATASMATAPAYADASLLIGVKPLVAELSSVRMVALESIQDFTAGHIEGAVQIDWPDLNLSDTSSDAALQAWQKQVEEKLGKLGLTQDDHIVAYDGGSLFAARLWWVLAYLGQQQTQVLNGGLGAWKDAGQKTSTTASNSVPATYRGTVDPSVLARLDEVRDALKQPDVVFLDARGPR